MSELNVVCASFDGASNMSGRHAGVQALLRRHSPNLVFVHCRSHLLQLALVKSAGNIVEVKRVLNLVNKLYTMFSQSPKKLAVLTASQLAIDGMAHKLVQPGETRWLSYDGSVGVVCRHYAAICTSLEAIYSDAADMACDASGMLIEFRKSSTIYLLCLLHTILQPLARLSKALQSTDSNISSSMTLVKATIEGIRNYNYDQLETEFSGM